MNGASSNSASPVSPMKLVATPRPERNPRKSIVGPWMVAFRPPAHSTCATLRPPRSADWAIDSAWRTPGSKAAVRAVPNASPFLWNVLLVDAWTPGHAPVASVYHPAPVFGGACVSRPLPDALVPALEELGHRGHHTRGGVPLDDVLAHAVRGEEHGLAGGVAAFAWRRSRCGSTDADRQQGGDHQQKREPDGRGPGHGTTSPSSGVIARRALDSARRGGDRRPERSTRSSVGRGTAAGRGTSSNESHAVRDPERTRVTRQRTYNGM